MIPSEWHGMLPIGGEIIVVEDDDILRALLADILQDIPAQFSLFATADEAYEHVLVTELHCPLLLTDYGLPGRLNGSQLALNFQARWPGIAIILTSGYDIDPQTLPADFAYLPKPWTGQQLVELIADLLQPGFPVGQR
ncbi:response regulator [Pseudomonas abietaniphila]|uniref:response regulator n=1 Tax=Pseudomonas abietaniphila TaxID=89065 RepID=UPI001EE71E43|nr:response regulator [Pseudomonas abietaniphila]